MNRGFMRGVPLPLRRTLMLSLGIVAIILGILGMHTLNVSHYSPGTAAAAQASAGTAGPGQAIQQGTGATHAAIPDTGAGGGLDAPVCDDICGGGLHSMAAACMLVVVGLVSLFIVPRQLRVKARHGLRAPPPGVAPRTPDPRTPSLVQLSISRT